MDRLYSRKFILTICTVITLVVKGMYSEAVYVVMTYLGAQGIADAGKGMGKPAGEA